MDMDSIFYRQFTWYHLKHLWYNARSSDATADVHRSSANTGQYPPAPVDSLEHIKSYIHAITEPCSNSKAGVTSRAAYATQLLLCCQAVKGREPHTSAVNLSSLSSPVYFQTHERDASLITLLVGYVAVLGTKGLYRMLHQMYWAVRKMPPQLVIEISKRENQIDECNDTEEIRQLNRQ